MSPPQSRHDRERATRLSDVARVCRLAGKSAASFAAAPAVQEEIFPSPAAEPETQAADDLFSSWETLSQHRQLQANDCDDPAGGCVADIPGYWCGYWLECSPEFLYTFQCRGWFCGWCSSNWDKKTSCKSHRSQYCNGGGPDFPELADAQCRP